jgi:hypothetical protein
MIDPDHQQAYSTQFRDAKLMDLDLRDWEVENSRSADWIHLPSGIRIKMIGRMGRWVIQYPTGRHHKAPGSKRASYIAKLSKAIGIALNSLSESFTKLIESNDAMTTVYHVTPDANLPKIRDEGLQPMIGSNSQQIGETVPAIHVFTNTDTLEDAIMNWDAMDWTDETVELSLITLQIPVSMVTASSKGFAALGQGIAEILEPVPPSMIVSISELY